MKLLRVLRMWKMWWMWRSLSHRRLLRPVGDGAGLLGIAVAVGWISSSLSGVVWVAVVFVGVFGPLGDEQFG